MCYAFFFLVVLATDQDQKRWIVGGLGWVGSNVQGCSENIIVPRSIQAVLPCFTLVVSSIVVWFKKGMHVVW